MRLIVTVPTNNDAQTLESLAREYGWRTLRPKTPGRPRVAERPGFSAKWARARREIATGKLSQREAANRLGCSARSVARLLAAADAGNGGGRKRSRNR